jgi:hypothetical protein
MEVHVTNTDSSFGNQTQTLLNTDNYKYLGTGIKDSGKRN